MTLPPTEALVFFNEREARIIDAIAARILPGDDTDPGAREAGATLYIDRALSGFVHELQSFYRRALRRLDAECVRRHGCPFIALATVDQDNLLAELEAAAGTEQAEPEFRNVSWDDADLLPTFFEVVREHLLQGTFCDPAYGGNRNLAGWKLIGFPGSHWSYSPEQMRRGFDSRLIETKTLADLRRERPWEAA